VSINIDRLKLLDALNVVDEVKAKLPPVTEASYIVYEEGGTYYTKNGRTGQIEFSSTDASDAIQYAINNISSGTVFIKEGVYDLTKDVQIANKSFVTVLGDNAMLRNGRIVVYGENYWRAQRNRISGIIFVNGGVRIENAMGTRIDSCKFENCTTGIELQNTRDWTELTYMSDLYFYNCACAIVFRTPAGGTDSYTKTMVSHVYIDMKENSVVGIDVESGTNIGESLFANVKIWFSKDGQVGFRHNGSANGAVMYNVSFESFVSSPTSLYGIEILEHASYPPYLVKPVWLGEFTSRIRNQYSKWLYGLGASFKDIKSIPIGVNDTYGNTVTVLENRQGTALIAPSIGIEVSGTFAPGEVVTLKIIFEYIDGSEIPIELTWTTTGEYWLSNSDLYNLLSSSSPLYAIKAQAKTNQTATSVSVDVKAFAFG